jgi:LuxR family transcriptional regulator, maltose regulon positive regulatory protein
MCRRATRNPMEQLLTTTDSDPGPMLPRLPSDAIKRPDLERALECGHPLTVLRAPAGFGKTTLLTQFAQSEVRRRDGTTIVWLSLDESLTDRDSVWPRVLHTLAEVAGHHTPAAESASTALERIQDIVRISRQVMIILDSFRFATDREIAVDIAQLLRALPNLRVLVATRIDSALEDLALSAIVDVSIVTANSLRFTCEEAHELIRSIATGDSLPRELADDARIPMAARLIGNAMARGILQTELGEGRQLLAGAILASLLISSWDQDLTEDLMKVSITRLLTRPLVRMLLGDPGSDRVLDEAERLGLGFWKWDHGEPLFELSSLVAEGLNDLLRRHLPAEVTPLRRIVAQYSLETGRAVDALSSAVAVSDLYLASRVAQTFWAELSNTHHAETARILTGVGDGLLYRHPLLVLLLAVTLSEDGKYTRARPLFDVALKVSHSKSRDADPVQRVWAFAILSSANRRTGRFKAAAACAESAVGILEAMSADEIYELGTSIIAIRVICGTSFLYCSRFTAAIHSFQLSVESAIQPREKFLTRALLAAALAIRGDIGEASAVVEYLDADSDLKDFGDTSYAYFFYLARSLILLERGYLDEAHDTVAVARRVRGATEHWAFSEYCQTAIWLFRNNPSLAIAHVETVMASHSVPMLPAGAALDDLRRLHFFALCATNQMAAASAVLSMVSSASPSMPAIRAYRAYLDGDFPKAMALSSAPRADPIPIESRRFEVLAKLTFAASAHRLGEDDACHQAASDAAALLQTHQLTTPLALFPTEGEPWLESVAIAAHLPGLRQRPLPLRVPAPKGFTPLSRREREVLDRLAGPGGINELADALSVSPNTIKTQLRAIYRKLGVASRADAVIAGAERGLIRRAGAPLER